MKIPWIFVIAAFLIPYTLVFLPGLWASIFIIADFYTPWKLYDSQIFKMYHSFLVDRLPEREEMPLPEIVAREASLGTIRKLTKEWTFPIVIRGMLGDAEGLGKWNDTNWWVENYHREELLCGSFTNVVENCTVRSFFVEMLGDKAFYISGASAIFDNNPELHKMIDNEHIRSIEPGVRAATQMFMGTPGMGTDVHSAIAVNIFRQIVGKKKWWFFPQSETPYLKPSININGFATQTQTLIGRSGGGQQSPWVTKLRRYTAVIGPGDVVINPPWYWHATMCLGERNATYSDLIIGSPTRYRKGTTVAAALGVNMLYTLIAMLAKIQTYGIHSIHPDFEINIQNDIANNRRNRDGKDLKTAAAATPSVKKN